MSFIIENIKGWWNSWVYFDKKESIKFNEDLLQCTNKQLEAELETEASLERTIHVFRENLEIQKRREKELIICREKLLQRYEQEEQKDEKIEHYLNVEFPLILSTIRNKIEQYEEKIERLEEKLQKLKETRKLTEENQRIIQEELAKQRREALTEDDIEAQVMNNVTEQIIECEIPLKTIKLNPQSTSSDDTSPLLQNMEQVKEIV